MRDLTSYALYWELGSLTLASQLGPETLNLLGPCDSCYRLSSFGFGGGGGDATLPSGVLR